MNRIKSFGVGCFNFGVKKDPPYVLYRKRYFSKLKNSLKKINNIKNLNVKIFDDFDDGKNFTKKKIKNKIPEISRDFNIFALDFKYFISFNLQISKKEQKRILSKKEDLSNYTTEFKIYIFSDNIFPVTIVELLDFDDNVKPFENVKLVKSFLKNKFKSDKYIRFEVLGPTPFHGDFYINKKNQDRIKYRKKLTYEINEKFTNTEFDLFIDSKNIDNYINILVEEFFILELMVYYTMVLRINKRKHKWINLSKKIDEIIEKKKNENFLSYINNFLFNSYNLKELIIRISEFKKFDIYWDEKFKREYNQILKKNREVIIESNFQELDNKKFSYPIEEMEDLILFLQNYQSERNQKFLLILSSLIGGSIGTLITLFLK